MMNKIPNVCAEAELLEIGKLYIFMGHSRTYDFFVSKNQGSFMLMDNKIVKILNQNDIFLVIERIQLKDSVKYKILIDDVIGYIRHSDEFIAKELQ